MLILFKKGATKMSNEEENERFKTQRKYIENPMTSVMNAINRLNINDGEELTKEDLSKIHEDLGLAYRNLNFVLGFLENGSIEIKTRLLGFNYNNTDYYFDLGYDEEQQEPYVEIERPHTGNWCWVYHSQLNESTDDEINLNDLSSVQDKLIEKIQKEDIIL